MQPGDVVSQADPANGGVAASMHNPTSDLGGGGNATADARAMRERMVALESELQRVVLILQQSAQQDAAAAQQNQSAAGSRTAREDGILPMKSNIKIHEPSTFDGDRSDDKVLDWIAEVRDYIGFHAMRNGFTSENEKILVAATYLVGDAKMAWRSKRQELEAADAAVPGGLAAWHAYTVDDFLNWMTAKFSDFNAQERRQLAYEKCRQGTRTVTKYAVELQRHANRLHIAIPDDLLLAKFRMGLSEEIQSAMSLVPNKPTTFEGFAALADNIDRQMRSNAENAKTRSRLYGSTSTQPRQGQEPLKPARQATQGSRQGNQFRSGSQQSSSNAVWMAKCRKENRCFRCGSQKHTASVCDASASTTAGSLNAIDDTASTAGKEPSQH